MKQKILLIIFSLFLISNNTMKGQAPTLPIGVEMPDNIVVACSVFPPAIEWGIENTWSSENIVSNLIIPLVGDLNDDGIPEIVCFGAAGRLPYQNRQTSPTVLVYDGATHSLLATITLPSAVSEYEGAPFGLVKMPNRTGLIVTASVDYKLRAYDITSGTINTPVWVSDIDYGSVIGDYAVNIGFADFDKDGNPEIFVRDKIYNASTGKLLATATGGSNAGLSYAHWSQNTNCKLSSPIAADVDNDGMLDLILGNEIYTVNITNPGGTIGNSITLLKTVTPPAGVIADGHAQVVDFNKDGYLDILISNRDIATHVGGKFSMYVWDVHNNTVSTPLILDTDRSGKSIPLIADVDNDGELEIVLQCGIALDVDNIRCYKYNAATMEFSYLWGFVPDEDSFSNGATLFDFNQDGMNELIISDQSKISIVNGSGKSHITKNDTIPVYIMTALNFGQSTIMQYPVIADVDADGAAEIVAVGLKDGTTGLTGSLNVFKSSTTPWAPARKVWNQYMYNAVNVNEDLTIPRMQMNPATVFAGSDGLLITAIDNLRPFNNFLQQQTTLSHNGTPLWLAPNGQIVGTPTFVYDNNEMTITVVVTNVGNASFQDPFKITAYKNSVSVSSTKYTHTHTGAIGVGQTETISFSIPNFSSWIKYNFIILKINDNGDGTNHQAVCNDSQGQYRYWGLLPTQQDACLEKAKDINITCCFTLSSTGNDSYKWQASKDGVTWPSGYISGATSVSYIPSAQKRGTMYYRVEVTDDDTLEKVFSEPAKIKLRSCQLPVNHNISVMGYYD